MNKKSELRIEMEKQGFSKQEIQKAYLKEYRKRNKERIATYSNSEDTKTRQANRYMQRRYGLTKDQYDTMIKEQGNKCVICGEEFGDRWTIHIDHCHTTGTIRGLLCYNCNIALGHVKDNTSILKSMIDYLTEANKHNQK